MTISEDEIPNVGYRTYRRRYLRYGGEQKPDDTLKNRYHINQVVDMTSYENRHYRTCPQSRRPKPNIVLSWRRQNRPMSIMRSKAISVIRQERRAGLLVSALP